ncbi:MAG TPA: shikimate dehydrogenase, partial [Jatrophihabitantaceae bacterium]|nr:shikimate dehydrogenase [Jatrophihabitantaceae bacterium]
IAHSLSPVLHRAAYAALGLDWTYDAIDCGVDELAGVLGSRSDWAGLSCTMPLKRAALEIADEVDATAATVGAANTLLPLDGGRGWRATNTDVLGIVASVREAGGNPETVTVLGAGGTAQAAVVACAQLDVARCAVLVRDPARTTELLDAAARAGVRVDIGVLSVDAAALGADLVASTLPAGAADVIAAHAWRAGQVVLDVVYEPDPTVLGAAARAAGAVVVSGASVLLHQAAAQVELMTGRPAPIEAMRAALSSARAG